MGLLIDDALLNDATLSWPDRLVLAEVERYPNGYVVHTQQLSVHLNLPIHAIRASISLLQNRNYVVRSSIDGDKAIRSIRMRSPCS